MDTFKVIGVQDIPYGKSTLTVNTVEFYGAPMHFPLKLRPKNTSKYMPHQGKQECERRKRRMRS